MQIPNETLVLYQGGGYDGCFWEWNSFFIDKEGKFHDLGSSGYLGCDNLQKFVDNFDEDYSNTAELFSQDELETFIENFHAGIVKSILDKLWDLAKWQSPAIVCPTCELNYDLSDMEIVGEDFMCYDCYQKSRRTWIIAYENREAEIAGDNMPIDLWELILPHWLGEDLLPKENLSLPMEVEPRYHNCLEEDEIREVDFTYCGEQVKSIQYKVDY